jgi:hypothetical protein
MDFLKSGAGAAASSAVEKISISKALEKLVALAVKIARAVLTVIQSLPLIKAIAFASVWLALFVAVAALILYLMYYLYPRIPQPNHSENVDEYTSTTCAEIHQNLRTLSTADLSWMASLTDVAALKRDVAALLARDDFRSDLAIYFAHKSSFDSLGYFASMDIRANLPQFIKDDSGALDTADFRNNFMKPLNDVKNRLDAVSKALVEGGDLRTRADGIAVAGATLQAEDNTTLNFETDTALQAEDDTAIDPNDTSLKAKIDAALKAKAKKERDAALKAKKDAALKANAVDTALKAKADAALAVHTARMLLNQQPEIELMAMTRRKKFPMGIWLVYYVPLIKDIYLKRIPHVWTSYPKRSENLMKSGFDWWYRVGQSFALLPCKMAVTDPTERAKVCKSSSGESFVATETIEGFGLSDIFGGIMSLVNIIVPLGLGIAQLCSNFLQDPFMTIIRMLLVILGVILGALLTLCHMMLSLTMIAYGIITIWVYVISLVVAYYYTVLLVLISVILGITYGILWLIDMPSGGFVMRMMRCDNKPDAWYAQSSFAEDNGWSKLNLPFCFRPCSSRYKAYLGGSCCKRLPSYMPDYCPQQQIYRIFRNGGPHLTDLGPTNFVDYPAPPGFSQRDQSAKAATLVSAYQDKVAWYQRCYSKLHGYDYLSRHLCDNMDLHLAGPENFLARDSMRAACKEIFCDYSPDDDIDNGDHAWRTAQGFQYSSMGGPVVPNEASCKRLADAQAKAADVTKGPGAEMLRRTIIAVSFVVVSLAALYTLLDIAPKVARVVWQVPGGADGPPKPPKAPAVAEPSAAEPSAPLLPASHPEHSAPPKITDTHFVVGVPHAPTPAEPSAPHLPEPSAPTPAVPSAPKSAGPIAEKVEVPEGKEEPNSTELPLANRKFWPGLLNTRLERADITSGEIH